MRILSFATSCRTVRLPGWLRMALLSPSKGGSNRLGIVNWGASDRYDFLPKGMITVDSVVD